MKVFVFLYCVKKILKLEMEKKTTKNDGSKTKEQRNTWQNEIQRIYFVICILLVICKLILGKLCVKNVVYYQICDT